MRRLLVIGRWLQVVAGVFAWLLLVPVFEVLRSGLGRLFAVLPRRKRRVKARPAVLSEERGPAA